MQISRKIKRVSVALKVQKLIRHEQSARSLGSTAEADTFAAKVKQLLLAHRLGADFISEKAVQARETTRGLRVTAEDAGIRPLRSRQEWTERLAFASAQAFHCALLLQPSSNAVLFEGRTSDRLAAAELYSELARRATDACEQEYSRWKALHPQLRGLNAPHFPIAAYTRRWKRSFLIGFSKQVCQKFVCGDHCRSQCEHSTTLIRIRPQTEVASRTPSARAIGGIELLYDAMYKGQAQAVAALKALARADAA